MTNPSSSRTKQDISKRLFVAFAGGGAKALVHIGALKALEEHGFNFSGVAGTSAGAIVAALKSAGYSADEIVDPVTSVTVLDVCGEKLGRVIRPIDLFGPFGWLCIRTAREIFIGHGVLKFIFYAGIFFSAATILAMQNASAGFISHMNTSFVFGLLIMCVFSAIFLTIRRGLASARTFRETFNAIMCHKLFPNEPIRDVLLSDLRQRKCLSLRIVAADLSNRQLRLFSSDNASDQNLVVADIVTASICIPFLFRPWRIADNYHVDGGIVSNLPAWPFDEERSLDLDAVTIAVDIKDNLPAKPVPSRSGWLSDFANTAMFGSTILNKRAVERLFTFPLQTDLGTLEFDLSREKALDTVRQATAAAKVLIIKQLEERPAVYEGECQRAKIVVESIVDALKTDFTNQRELGRVRVALAFPQDGFVKSVRLKYTAGFENDLDEGVILPLDGSVIGTAWRAKRAVIHKHPFKDFGLPGYNRLYRLFAKDIRWILAVPIFRSNDRSIDPDFVVAVDGSGVLANNRDSALRVGTAIADEMKLIFSPIAQRLETL